MKFIKYLFVAVCLFIGTQANSYAQTKIGHLNSLDLLNSMPEWKAAETQYQTYLEQLSNMLKSKDEELIKQATRVQQLWKEGKVSQLDYKAKMMSLQEKDKKLAEEKAAAEQNVAKKEEELTKPIKDRVTQAISDVATEKGYTYVLDSGAALGLLFVSPSEDITAFVKAKLNLR